MDTAELLISLKTALDSGGADALIAKLGEITKQTTESSAGGAKLNAEFTKTTESLHTAGRAGVVLQQVLEGNARGAVGLANTLGFGGLTGTIMAAVGAFIAFEKIGEKIGGKVIEAELKAEQDAFDEVARHVNALRDKIDKLNNADLSTFKSEIGDLSEKLSAELAKLDKAYSRIKELSSADTAVREEQIKRKYGDTPEAGLLLAENRFEAAQRESYAPIAQKQKQLDSVKADIDRQSAQKQQLNDELAAAKAEVKRIAQEQDARPMPAPVTRQVIETVNGQPTSRSVVDEQATAEAAAAELGRRRSEITSATGVVDAVRSKQSEFEQQIGKVDYMGQLQQLKDEIAQLKADRERKLAPEAQRMMTARDTFDRAKASQQFEAFDENQTTREKNYLHAQTETAREQLAEQKRQEDELEKRVKSFEGTSDLKGFQRAVAMLERNRDEIDKATERISVLESREKARQR